MGLAQLRRDSDRTLSEQGRCTSVRLLTEKRKKITLIGESFPSCPRLTPRIPGASAPVEGEAPPSSLSS